MLLIPADKTTNYYAMKENAETYNKLITDNVTKTHKKSTDAAINSEAANIAKNLKNQRRKQGLISEERECDRAPSRSSKLSQESVFVHASAICKVDCWDF